MYILKHNLTSKYLLMLLQLHIFLLKKKKKKQMKKVFWLPFRPDENFRIQKFDLKQIWVAIKYFRFRFFLTYNLSHILQ